MPRKASLSEYFYSSLSRGTAYVTVEGAECGIENSLHWVLDVTFNEDASRVRLGHGAENLGLLRRLSVNLLKREPSKMSLKMKRYRASMDDNFMVKILEASAVD